jgi:hypothetical protein
LQLCDGDFIVGEDGKREEGTQLRAEGRALAFDASGPWVSKALAYPGSALTLVTSSAACYQKRVSVLAAAFAGPGH